MKARWCEEKNRVLKFRYGLSFRNLLEHRLINIGDHPTRADQKMAFYERAGYVWVVPFVVEENGFFLKTLHPSRKYTRLYREGKLGEEDKKNGLE